MHVILYLLALITALTSCSGEVRPKECIALAELSDTIPGDFATFSPKPVVVAPYPWQDVSGSNLRPITIEHFRCKGSSLNPARIVMEGSKEVDHIYDCSGSERHSLPLQDGKEYIYPVLLELVNEIQRATKCPVIITSGHRCPSHGAYIDSSPKASGSKHLIGAEVDFYVQGLESCPEKALQIVFDHYKKDPTYANQKEYSTFLRWEKQKDTATAPWYNKEVFIKLYKKHEGRNFDNRHPYAYISIQVRFDREKNERIAVSYQRANQLLRK